MIMGINSNVFKNHVKDQMATAPKRVLVDLLIKTEEKNKNLSKALKSVLLLIRGHFDNTEGSELADYVNLIEETLKE